MNTVDVLNSHIGVIDMQNSQLPHKFDNGNVKLDQHLKAATKTFVNVKVLLVEDIPLIQIVNTRLLKKLGCRVTLAKCGSEAVNAANTEHFDLIFMDIGLPDFNGIDATKAIRKNDSVNSRTPIVAFTTESNDMKKSCLAAGMNDFLSKPSPLPILSDTINKWTH